MSKPVKIAAVVNPNSAGGKTARQWPQLAALLENRMGRVVTRFTDKRGAGIAIARGLLREGFDLIIAVGGDGTVNEVANGFFDGDQMVRPEAVLGILPFGTGGDFRRTLEIPADAAGAIEILATGVPAQIDIGKATFQASGGQASRYFVNLLSFGMGGHVAAQSNNFMSTFGGKAAFFWATVKTFLSYRGRQVDLSLDGSSTRLPFFITNVAVGNGQFHGGGMRPCPAAVPNDGVLDVTIIGYDGALKLLSSISMLYSGKVYSHPKVRHFEAARIIAEAKGAAQIEIDGEPLGMLPLEVILLPRGLRVLVAPSSPLLKAPEAADEGTTIGQKNSLGCKSNPG
ncbi:MAG: diacylglycerol kinase family lipid kinase [Acidobacteria bacterium]|nr:MAG: diacylglycerol kinase family lipid kinase [Acidobacteriota bacterium]